ncbi:MAG: MFS transporter [Acidimicrobiia bacterium]
MGRTGLGASYHRLVAGSGASNLADGVFLVALPLLTVELTTSPILVAGVALAQRLPWLVVALPAGALADRLDRRRTMVRVNLLRVAVLGGVAVAVATDTASLPLIYAVALILGVGETFFDTAAQSIMPAVVGSERLSEANGRLYAVELVANQFVGPVLGGALAGAGLALAFAGSAGAYLLAAGALAVMAGSFRPVRTGPPTRLRTDIVEGLRFLWGHRLLRTLGLMLGMSNLAFAAQGSVFVLFAVAPGPMGLSESGFGLLFATWAVGGLVGSWVAAPAERLLGRAWVLSASVFAGSLGLVVPVVTAAFVPVAASGVVMGVAMVCWNVVTVSLRQRITPDRLLGRLNAGYRLLGWGTMPIGAALGGLVAEFAGVRAAFAVSAVLNTTVLLGCFVVTDQAMAQAEAAVDKAA